MHRLLERQLRRHFGSVEAAPPGLLPLLSAIDEAYSQSDADRALLERSLELSSDELLAVNRYLDAALNRTHAIINAAGDGILCLDVDDSAVLVNPAAALMLEWNVDEMLGHPLHGVIHYATERGESMAEAACPIVRTLRTGQPHHQQHDAFHTRSGKTIQVEYTSTPIFGDDGSVSGAVVMFRDIQGRLLAEQQLVQSQKLESIGQLAAGIAHEINTPIQYVSDNLRFLQDARNDRTRVVATHEALLQACEEAGLLPELASEVRRVQDEVDIAYLNEETPKAFTQSFEGLARVTKIVRAMRDFSHPDSEEQSPVDLNKLIDSTATIARNEWKYVSDLELDLEDGLPLVHCFGGDVGQAVLNLIVNAAHAIQETVGTSGQKGLIRVVTRSDGDTVVIEVADTGCGIPEHIQARIFDPFFTTKDVGKGTGQGLTLARRVVVEKHGGQIWFDSEPGGGTTFFIRLPVGASDASRDERAA